MEEIYLSSSSATEGGQRPARVRVRVLAQNAVRITHLAPGQTKAPEDRPWLEHVLVMPEGDVSPGATGQHSLTAELLGGCVHIRTREGKPLLAEARPARTDALGRGVQLSLDITEGEGFYGWGEWFNAFRRERGTVRLWSSESPAVLQSRRTYSNIPFFLSSRGYGFLLLNSHKSTWRIAPKEGMLEVDAAGPPADFVVIYGPAFRDIVKTYTELTGRPPLVPRWAFGLWVTEYPQEGQEQAQRLVEEHRRRAIPLDAVILDYHWEERFHNLHWRRALFPEPEKLIGRLRELGVKLGLIFTPFVNNRNAGLQKVALNALFHNVPAGREKDDERALPEYEEARSKSYLAHAQARWWFGSGGMIDFTNPEAAAWWNAKLRPLYEAGVAFFKNDDGEYLPSDSTSALGMDGREYHNLYGLFYGKAIYEGMAALDNRRPLIYARSVWAGSQRYPALFLGDQKPTFEHMRATMRAGLNMSLAGFSYWTADVFGLDGKTTPETHMRYAQWALLAPIARYFWRPPQVDGTRFPWSHGPQVEANFRRYVELRYRLLPYYYTLAWEAFRTGLPIVRPLLMEFQDDPRVADIADQFMLGERLLLAPVLLGGARRRKVYLPGGLWHDIWSAQTYEGGREIQYAAPLDRLPILVRGGTILPMGPAAGGVQHIAEDHSFDPLQFHVWPPYPANGALYEDDGRTREYQSRCDGAGSRPGAYAVTQVRADQEGGTVTVRVGAAEGDFSGKPASRTIEFVLHRLSRPKTVRVSGEESLDWSYDAQRCCASVQVRWPTHSELVVELELKLE